MARNAAATNNQAIDRAGDEISDDAVDTGTATSRRTGGPVCPENAAHRNTLVYKTKGMIQYCKCNDCGHTWKRNRPAESVGGVSNEVMLALADTFDSAPQIQHGDRLVIVIPIEDAKRTSRRIRELCQA